MIIKTILLKNLSVTSITFNYMDLKQKTGYPRSKYGLQNHQND